MKKKFLAIILAMIMLLQTQAVVLAAPHSEVHVNDGVSNTVNGSDESSSDSLEEEAPTSIVNFEMQLSLDFPISKAGIDYLKDAFMVTLQRTDVEEAEHFKQRF